MNYNKIRKMDISNGPGIRISIFMQGCAFHCENCFNPETWDFKLGNKFTDDTIETVLDLCKLEYIQGLSILGGEPLHPKNIGGTTKLAKEFKRRYPDKDLWVWTGFLYEDVKDNEIFKYVNVLVDGQYKDDERNWSLKYRGSANQRVIDIENTLKNKKIITIVD